MSLPLAAAMAIFIKEIFGFHPDYMITQTSADQETVM